MLEVIGKTYGVSRELLERIAGNALEALEINDAQIELKFVSVPEITRLNSVYRGKNEPTDVLSFTLDNKPLLGQIFICYTFVARQAKSLQKNLMDEVALLLAHGILHIAGYDHLDVKQEAEMLRVETEILNREGISR